MRIVIPGRPIPYVRMTQRGKYVKKNAQRYLAYKDIVGYTAKTSNIHVSDKKIKISVFIYLNGKKTPMGMDGDSDNYLKTACDSLNGIAYIDDRQITEAHVWKYPCQKDEERMEIFIGEVEN
jgi:Holliday junction resolvase RusA-like endonuclease